MLSETIGFLILLAWCEIICTMIEMPEFTNWQGFHILITFMIIVSVIWTITRIKKNSRGD
jgi:hypothetical protein